MGDLGMDVREGSGRGRRGSGRHLGVGIGLQEPVYTILFVGLFSFSIWLRGLHELICYRTFCWLVYFSFGLG